ncbi:MAG: FG-GAP-like repeat-containing protein, partial [Thermoanaerobaculia bacterium]|nr:FG-GAP-like repeat-containing protein [Thermoanaerobaculia bacterium]
MPRPYRLLVATLVAAAFGCGDGGPTMTEEEVAAALQQAGGHMRAREWAQAVAVLDPALAASPERPIAWIWLAQARRELGDFDASLEASTMAAGFPPARGGALTQEFLTRVAMGDHERALTLYRAMRTFPTIDFSSLHLGPELAGVRDDERYAELFPADFDRPFVEAATILHDWHGEGPGLEFGWEARAIGDVDGDGAADLVASAPANQPGGDSAGTVFVYSGASGAELWRVVGAPGDQLGMGIEAAGDVDGDGVPDVAAGAPGAARAYIYSGSDGTVIHELSPPEGRSGSFGAKTAGTGDVDGDGGADVVVGAPGAGNGAGAAMVFSGADGSLLAIWEGAPGEALGTTVAGGEGFVIVGAPNAGEGNRGEVRVYRGLEAEPAFVIAAEETGQQLGGMFASVVGDVDADGTPDIYASDWQDAAAGPMTGRVYVHSGATGERLWS